MRKVLNFDFILDVQDADGRLRAQEKIGEDLFSLMVDDALFSATCEGRLTGSEVMSRAVVEPLCQDGAASPEVRGSRVTLYWDAGDNAYQKSYGKSAFALKAKQAAYALLKEQPGEDSGGADDAVEKTFSWRISAFPRAASDSSGDRPAPLWRPLPILEKHVSDFGIRFPNPDGPQSYEVFVSRHILEEIQQLTLRTDGEREQAGFLIGYLGRDPESRRLYSIVTAHFPATVGVEAQKDTFTFRAESFMEIRKMLALRQSNEILLGWQHNHHFCPGCPANLSGSTICFSLADHEVQSAAFRFPYMFGLVAGRDLDLEPWRPAIRMYGWRDAEIQERKFTAY